jgi:hypothetical protein
VGTPDASWALDDPAKIEHIGFTDSSGQQSMATEAVPLMVR